MNYKSIMTNTLPRLACNDGLFGGGFVKNISHQYLLSKNVANIIINNAVPP